MESAEDNKLNEKETEEICKTARYVIVHRQNLYLISLAWAFVVILLSIFYFYKLYEFSYIITFIAVESLLGIIFASCIIALSFAVRCKKINASVLCNRKALIGLAIFIFISLEPLICLSLYLGISVSIVSSLFVAAYFAYFIFVIKKINKLNYMIYGKTRPAKDLQAKVSDQVIASYLFAVSAAKGYEKFERQEQKEVASQKRKEEKQAADRAKIEKALRENEGSTFTGGAFANAGVNILFYIVCLITLGLAYPAMECWRQRWVCRHTYISGRQLVFNGKAMLLFGKYLLWWFLSLITLGIYYLICMEVSVAKWQTKNTHFVDTEITQNNENLSKFDGRWYQLFGVNWLCRLITTITFSFGIYWAHCYKERWKCKHTTIDGCKIIFDGKGIQYFGKCIVWFILTVVTLGIYAFWLAVKKEKWTCSHKKIEGN